MRFITYEHDPACPGHRPYSAEALEKFPIYLKADRPDGHLTVGCRTPDELRAAISALELELDELKKDATNTFTGP